MKQLGDHARQDCSLRVHHADTRWVVVKTEDEATLNNVVRNISLRALPRGLTVVENRGVEQIASHVSLHVDYVSLRVQDAVAWPSPLRSQVSAATEFAGAVGAALPREAGDRSSSSTTYRGLQ